MQMARNFLLSRELIIFLRIIDQSIKILDLFDQFYHFIFFIISVLILGPAIHEFE